MTKIFSKIFFVVNILIRARKLPLWQPKTFEFPNLKTNKNRVHFPIIAIVAPIVIGLSSFFIFNNGFMLMFCALSPIMALGRFIDSKRQTSRSKKQERLWFEKQILKCSDKICADQSAEIEFLNNIFLGSDFCKQSIRDKSAWLWSSNQTKVYLKIGNGNRKSLTRIEYDDTLLEKLPEIKIILDQLQQMVEVPIGVELEKGQGIAIYHPNSQQIINAMLLQLIHTHPPSKISIHGFGNFHELTKDLPHYTSAEQANVLLVDAHNIKEKQLAIIIENKTAIVIWKSQKIDDAINRCHYRLSNTFLESFNTFEKQELTTFEKISDSDIRKIGHEMQDFAEFNGSAAIAKVIENTAVVAKQPLWFSEKVSNGRVMPIKIGIGVNEPVELDLVKHGPHMLIAGMTGSGKSELLKTIILNHAHQNSPEELNFLLIDFKGGSAFGKCQELPHCVGIITDLSKELAKRCLISLSAEIKYREKLLARFKSKDIEQYQKKALVSIVDVTEKSNNEAMPNLARLYIIVDEFATLAKQIPDFLDGILDIAQRGRSLGIHLILATQHPSGVVSDNVLANINIKFSLRVADKTISKSLIGDNRAANITVNGRGFIKIGNKEAVEVQTTYSANQEKEVVDNCKKGFLNLGMHPLRKPWVNELPLVWYSERYFCLIDDPASQKQYAFSPDFSHNLIIIGESKSGKTTAIKAFCAQRIKLDPNLHIFYFGKDPNSIHECKDIENFCLISDYLDDEFAYRFMLLMQNQYLQNKLKNFLIIFDDYNCLRQEYDLCEQFNKIISAFSGFINVSFIVTSVNENSVNHRIMPYFQDRFDFVSSREPLRAVYAGLQAQISEFKSQMLSSIKPKFVTRLKKIKKISKVLSMKNALAIEYDSLEPYLLDLSEPIVLAGPNGGDKTVFTNLWLKHLKAKGYKIIKISPNIDDLELIKINKDIAKQASNIAINLKSNFTEPLKNNVCNGNTVLYIDQITDFAEREGSIISIIKDYMKLMHAKNSKQFPKECSPEVAELVLLIDYDQRRSVNAWNVNGVLKTLNTFLCFNAQPNDLVALSGLTLPKNDHVPLRGVIVKSGLVSRVQFATKP